MKENPLYRRYRTEERQSWNLERAYRWYFRGWLPTDRAARILDAGCGEGELLCALREWGYANVHGVELRQDAVDACLAKALSVTRNTALEALGDDSQWDLILAIDVLEHMPLEESLNFLVAAGRRLRPGGSLLIQAPNLASPFGGAVFYGDLTHCLPLNPTSLAQVLRNAGYSHIQWRPAGPGPWSVSGALRWLLWMPIECAIRAWNVIETGSAGGPVLTRVMFCRAQPSTTR